MGARPPGRDPRPTSSNDRSSPEPTAATGSGADEHSWVDDTSTALPNTDAETAGAVSCASGKAAEATSVPPRVTPKQGKITGKVTGQTAGVVENASSETPVTNLPLAAVVTDPAKAGTVFAVQAGGRVTDTDGPADAKDADPAPTSATVARNDASAPAIVPASTIRPSVTAKTDVAAPDEGEETASKTDETASTDATAPPSATPPQPAAIAVPAIQAVPILTGAEGGAEATPMSGSAARTAVWTAAGPAAARPAAGLAGAKAPVTPVEAADGGEAAPVQAKPAGALTAGEASPNRVKAGTKTEVGAQASATPATASIDFAAHFAQMTDPASVLAAQPLPAAAATSTSGGGEVSQTAAAVPIGDVPVEIGLRALDGSSRFDIRLSPEDLGRIDVKLDIDGDGQVKAHLVVDRPETLAFLQRDGEALHRAFEQAGFKPAESGIAFSLRDPGQDGGGRNGSGENGQRAQPPAWTRQGDREAGPDAVPTTWRTLQAGRAGVDLRI